MWAVITCILATKNESKYDKAKNVLELLLCNFVSIKVSITNATLFALDLTVLGAARTPTRVTYTLHRLGNFSRVQQMAANKSRAVHANQ